MKYTINSRERLYTYGLWYYLKYFPAREKVKAKLLDKSNNRELSEEVLQMMGPIIDEEGNIRARIRYMLFRNKNLGYIKTNLLLKKYDKELSSKILEEEFIKSSESLLSEFSTRKKIEEYSAKGKSRQYILAKLIERNPDRELVEKLCDEVLQDGDEENIKREYEKLKEKYEKNKIIEKLLRRGFLYNDIKKVVEK